MYQHHNESRAAVKHNRHPLGDISNRSVAVLNHPTKNVADKENFTNTAHLTACFLNHDRKDAISKKGTNNSISCALSCSSSSSTSNVTSSRVSLSHSSISSNTISSSSSSFSQSYTPDLSTCFSSLSISSTSFCSSSTSTFTSTSTSSSASLQSVDTEFARYVKLYEGVRDEEMMRQADDLKITFTEMKRRQDSRIDERGKQLENAEADMTTLEPAFTALQLIDDVDTKGSNSSANEYTNEIMNYLYSREKIYVPTSSFLSNQHELSAEIRESLVDWLIEIHFKFNLLPETLYLTISYLDRFLSKKSVTRSTFQLVGCVSMLLAAKMEELRVPEVEDFVYVTSKAYSAPEILAMERIVLAALDFDLNSCTINQFLSEFMQAAQLSNAQKSWANYLAESTFQDYKMASYLPSVVAASAVYLSLHLTNSKLERPFSYQNIDELKPCIKAMHAIISSSKPTYNAVRRKYSRHRYLEIANASKFPIKTL
eukprot:TRINITY_DN7507_c0_g1_i1.p1 TRINITY_DN7507_c0_g1~~TRINITY_DN7507_c0_g1_i1.p1  ORF type:complete len:485 (+),score=85.82 TRINITY_DN7507_c0_g1_i1:80-1534(+)